MWQSYILSPFRFKVYSIATPEHSMPLAEQSPSQIEISEPLLEFARFLKPPIELRLEIWNLTMLPRTVVIHVHEFTLPDPDERPLVELLSVTPSPIALQVCQESRREAQRTYRLCFGTELFEKRELGNATGFFRAPRTYFSYEMDTAHFVSIGKQLRRELPVGFMSRKDLDNVRHIFQDEIDVTEATYRLLPDRLDIYQFMDAFITARDVFAPEYKIPLLKVTSMNNSQMCDHVYSLTLGRPAKWGYGHFRSGRGQEHLEIAHVQVAYNHM